MCSIMGMSEGNAFLDPDSHFMLCGSLHTHTNTLVWIIILFAVVHQSTRQRPCCEIVHVAHNVSNIANVGTLYGTMQCILFLLRLGIWKWNLLGCGANTMGNTRFFQTSKCKSAFNISSIGKCLRCSLEKCQILEKAFANHHCIFYEIYMKYKWHTVYIPSVYPSRVTFYLHWLKPNADFSKSSFYNLAAQAYIEWSVTRCLCMSEAVSFDPF